MLIPRAPFYVSVLNIIAVIFAGCYGDGFIAPHFIAFISIMHLVLCLLGYYCLKSIEDLQSSNEIYRNNESCILKAFNMSHEELMAYLQLCRHRNGSGGNDVSQFFKLLDAKTEQSIIEAVEARKAEREAEQAELLKRFPKLTETELTICRLVIVGKTQKEIARITGKSESNISTVRGHIRKKLALTPDQDLCQSLLPA